MKNKIPILFLSALPCAAFAEQKPNVIIIYVDDMGIGDLSCYGGTLIQTPNIDRLAGEGIRFTQYYSAAPVSSPSRVGITTGQFPLNRGINTYLSDRQHNLNCEQNDFLDPAAPSMARAFQQAGYSTGHFGKWHMGGGRDVDNAPSISAYGFDEYISTWESPDPHPYLTSSNWIWAASDSIKRWNRTSWFIDNALDFIERNSSKPFFINLWPDDVHTPWVPGEQYVQAKDEWYEKQTFIPVLRELDNQVGRLIQGLKEMKVLDNTIIIFTSDNGPAPSFEQIRTLGMRGTKNSLYEGGIRMPFIVRWGEKIKPGQVNEHSVVCAVDLYLSLCNMANIPPEKAKFDGCDMSIALSEVEEQKRAGLLFWDFGRNKYFNFPKYYHRSSHLAVRKDNWKLLCNADGSGVELYDLSKDVNETNNLADRYQLLSEELKNKCIEWYNSKR